MFETVLKPRSFRAFFPGPLLARLSVERTLRSARLYSLFRKESESSGKLEPEIFKFELHPLEAICIEYSGEASLFAKFLLDAEIFRLENFG